MNAYSTELLARDHLASMHHEAEIERRRREPHAPTAARPGIIARSVARVRSIGRAGGSRPSMSPRASDLTARPR